MFWIVKVKIEDGFLYSVAGKGSIIVSNNLVLESVPHVLNLSCNSMSDRGLKKDLGYDDINFSFQYLWFLEYAFKKEDW